VRVPPVAMKAKHLFLLSLGIVSLLITAAGVASLFMIKTTVIVLAFDTAPAGDKAIELTTEVLRKRIKAFGSEQGVGAGKVQYRQPNFVVTLRGKQPLGSFSEVLLPRNDIRLHLAADAKAHETFEATGRVPEGFDRHVITHERVKLGSLDKTYKTEEVILLRKNPEMTIQRLKTVHMARQGWGQAPVITIEFDQQQALQFAELTRKHTGERLALAIEDEVFSAPTIQGEISGGVVQIRNIVYHPKARKLYELLHMGALPAPLRVVEITLPEGEQPAPGGARRQHAAAIE
jgi:preprotein translocase subunit SecD